ncbi:hypothetical protein BCR39DRAFT_520802 [Naematelia encephala]|uniref:Nucleotide-diphospho-sugar transferase n=1 Tax=Naematelia encephala TaxID=71784 RepID=A0A1Y2BEY9_9TREE|nr:hypothetical protein BCR39DRAFT_520802 [Naematelia encephala]
MADTPRTGPRISINPYSSTSTSTSTSTSSTSKLPSSSSSSSSSTSLAGSSLYITSFLRNTYDNIRYSSSFVSLNSHIKSRRRLLISGLIISFTSFFVLGRLLARSGGDGVFKVTHIIDVDDDGRGDMWGWTEQMGWEQDSHVGLLDLGEIAEERYRLGVSTGEQGTIDYYTQLHQFVLSLPTRLHHPFTHSLISHLPPSLSQSEQRLPIPIPNAPAKRRPASMISYKIIHQTDKVNNHAAESDEWKKMNAVDGWRLNFLDDQAAEEWVYEVFRGSNVLWAWKNLHRGVLKADFLRYLLPLIVGGVYSDVDTRPIRPIEQWGTLRVETLDLSEIDGSTWRELYPTHPAVMVAVDVDVHAHPTWSEGWPRPLGICQWTLAAAPAHPIFIDAARRVVNNTKEVMDWEADKAAAIRHLEEERPEGWEDEVQEMQKWGRERIMNVMEWTGPGLFTDSVLSFLLARYQVTWHRLRGLDHPLRIGDVLILPITAFSPGGQKDFHAEGPDSPQADVLHDFRGSWKKEGV